MHANNDESVLPYLTKINNFPVIGKTQVILVNQKNMNHHTVTMIQYTVGTYCACYLDTY